MNVHSTAAQRLERRHVGLLGRVIGLKVVNGVNGESPNSTAPRLAMDAARTSEELFMV